MSTRYHTLGTDPYLTGEIWPDDTAGGWRFSIFNEQGVELDCSAQSFSSEAEALHSMKSRAKAMVEMIHEIRAQEKAS